MSAEEIRRQNMSPADYLNWRLKSFGIRSRDAIYKRKMGIQTRVSNGVGGPAGLTNEKLDLIIAGEVPEETIQEWIQEARREKEARGAKQTTEHKPMPQRTELTRPQRYDRGNYNADLAEPRDKD